MLGLSLVDTFVTLSSVLKYLGVKYVFDASSGGDVALIEAREEFMKRFLFSCSDIIWAFLLVKTLSEQYFSIIDIGGERL
jgi:hypothetical protein